MFLLNTVCHFICWLSLSALVCWLSLQMVKGRRSIHWLGSALSPFLSVSPLGRSRWCLPECITGSSWLLVDKQPLIAGVLALIRPACSLSLVIMEMWEWPFHCGVQNRRKDKYRGLEVPVLLCVAWGTAFNFRSSTQVNPQTSPEVTRGSDSKECSSCQFSDSKSWVKTENVRR